MTEAAARFVGSAALLHGYSASVAERLMREPVRRALRTGQLERWQAVELAETLRALERAAADWRASVDGSNGRAAAEVEPSSPHEQHVDTAEASEILCVSERRVRQRAAALGGWKAGGRWLFDRDELLACCEHDQRGAA